MAQLKLLILIANIVFLRLVAASPESITSSSFSSSLTALDNINSLDFAPNEQTSLHQQHDSATPTPTVANKTVVPIIAPSNSRRRAGKSNKIKTSSAASKRRQAAANYEFGSASIAKMLIDAIGQLERVDFKRLLSDSIKQMQNSSDFKHLTGQISSRSSTGNNTKAKLNGPLSNEAGNFLSVTKQLMKLARSGIMPTDSYSAYPSYWSSTSSMMPSMLSAASHMFAGHDQADFTGASLKSDWFWLIAPAIIVIGSGVIVIPLIAAWLVSYMMNQNSLTVTAGRRRRKREAHEPQASGREDLATMLGVSQLLEDPRLMAESLGKFHRALESVAASFNVKLPKMQQ